jgi:TonB family protein
MTDKRRISGHQGVGPGTKEPPLLLDSTLPPTPIKQLLAAEGAAIAVLSTDSNLFETIHQAGGEQYPMAVASTWQDLLAEIERRQCGIVVLDVDSVTETLERRLAELRGVMPNVVVLIASPRKEAEALVGLLSDRKIHRLLMKPPALGITRLLLESAVSRWLEVRESGAAAAARDATSQVEALREPASRMPPWVLALALLVGGAGGVAWWLGRPADAPPPVVMSPGQASSPAARGQPAAAAQPATGDAAADPLLEGILLRAREAAAAGRLDAPPGDNALDHYLAILRIEPEHVEAGREVDRLLEGPFARAEEALLAGAVEDAAMILDRVRRVRPESARLRFLDVQLSEAMARRDEAAAQAELAATQVRTAAGAPPSEVASLLTLAETRLRRGELLLPAGDNAKIYVDRATELAPGDPAVIALRAALAQAVLGSTQALIGVGEVDRASALLREAEALGGDAGAIRDARARLSEIGRANREQQLAEWRAAAVERLDAGQLIAPAEDNALYYLGRARSLSPADASLEAPWQRLLASLGAEARAAIDERRWDDASRWIEAMQAADPANPAVANLSRDARIARTQAAYLETPVAASDLELLSGDAPEYPENALRNNIEGWVEIEFIVDREGQPRDIAVLGAEPPGRFEEAALAAAATYRFTPFLQDGVVYERRTTVRIRFALE